VSGPPLPTDGFRRFNMRYRLLGNRGLRVSEAALGTMTLGDDWGWVPQKTKHGRCTMLSAKPGQLYRDRQRIREREERIVLSGGRDRSILRDKGGSIDLE
jgi:hypothetical protein